MIHSISAREARQLAIAGQGLHTAANTWSDVFAAVHCVQLDPLKAVRESHEMVGLARGLDVAESSSLLTATAAFQSFVYPGHAMAILPMALWPWFSFRRRRIQANGWRGPEVDPQAVERIRCLLSERPSVTVKDFDDRAGQGWARSSSLRVAAEWLLWTGEAISTSRQGARREYVRSNAVLPVQLLEQQPDDADCLAHLVNLAIDALGVATLDDIADYFRLRKPDVEIGLQGLALDEARVEGWSERAWISRRAASCLEAQPDRVVPLSPFDSLVWFRPRLLRLFGKSYALEAYKPAQERVFGHYFVPVLSGGAIVGRVGPRRVKGKLHIEAQECDGPRHRDALDHATRLLTSWAEAEQCGPSAQSV
ncbi:hypothetical protein SAMN05216359_107147 [Roseateles sp. YR242]|uniref:DNA glycosylase AlkZ-like family protein n=1 Tax=Roseateles sp. YR242 TaxID=1855305 RepID=UPI0008CB56B6|nr:crosslink repair DNA glycosylase YcaQ family protein [Roseateles sp. YR242]SEL30178.1 hypothetical protein SAMN05216359_107147 [Roseateles sp. YR242]